MQEMKEELHNFLRDLFILVQDKYNESLSEELKLGAEADVAYHQGAILAYYDVLALIRSQVLAFGYSNASSEFKVPELGKPANGAA